MSASRMNITAVRLTQDSAVQFSVYGPGWGYRAYSISPHVICEELGAANTNPRQISLAFELGKPRILKAVQSGAGTLGMDGRMTLAATDFRVQH